MTMIVMQVSQSYSNFESIFESSEIPLFSNFESIFESKGEACPSPFAGSNWGTAALDALSSASGRMGADRDRWEEPKRGSLSWFIFFGLMGATATTVALRSRWFASTGSNRRSYSEQAWKRYNNRMQEEHEEEMERMERIRRMQSVFNRERSKYKKTYESWQDQGAGAYQHSPRNDWYWETDKSSKNKTNYRAAPGGPIPYGHHMWSHHYAVLGLDRFRAEPYSDAEIKTAFRAKAMECHPDQNQENKEAAEAKFKEVLKSYEAIKWERNNTKH